MRVRAGLVAVIYQKALVLSNDERGKASGDIVNLMSVDASRLQDLCTYGIMIVSAPFQVTENVFLTPCEYIVNPDNPPIRKGNPCVHFIVQPSRMVRVRGSWDYGCFSSVEHRDRSFLEEPSNKADEV